ncbi:MAG: hypothetical protein M3297_06270, partial [Thermoproteota archaeon]|nr:hypothetical protein [Thermoproteota archaeon]
MKEQLHRSNMSKTRLTILRRLDSSPISNVAFSSEDGEIYGNNTRIKIEPIYEGLTLPTAIAFLGPNDMLVLSGHEEY